VLRYPQLVPPPSVRAASEAAVNSVEVVVAPDGTVERIRFIAGPIRLSDIMLVQAVKTWRFSPALKDGEPVRYQTVISWPGTP
jgi:outer membrane biosynthesis protein TonB